MNIKLLCTFLFLVISTVAKTQDTLFFDKHEFKTDNRNEAVFFRIHPKKPIDSANYSTTLFYISGQKKSERTIKQKVFVKEVNYYESGQVQSELDLDKDGYVKIVSYYKLGQRKRTDIFEKGKLIDGKCYNSKGEVIAHTDYEVMPEFPGGENAMLTFISQNLKYPKEAMNKNLEGKVVVNFQIKTDGTIDNVKVRERKHESLDAEAIRVIKAMPHWKPGMQDGTIVEVNYALPIMFQLYD
ncbi:MAG: energy transducer TonB [Bacteroidetes bacterium]|nr:energy transducer TonB [Bacteroidota bacterium]